MLLRITTGLFLIWNFSGCTQENIERAYGFLDLRVEGYDEDIKWESVSGIWIESLGKLDMEATSYFFDRCTIHLENVSNAGNVNPLTPMKFYYTDGIDFKPYAISGSITITEAINKATRGTFNLYMDNNYNGVSGKRISGDCGVVNKSY